MSYRSMAVTNYKPQCQCLGAVISKWLDTYPWNKYSGLTLPQGKSLKHTWQHRSGFQVKHTVWLHLESNNLSLLHDCIISASFKTNENVKLLQYAATPPKKINTLIIYLAMIKNKTFSKHHSAMILTI